MVSMTPSWRLLLFLDRECGGYVPYPAWRFHIRLRSVLSGLVWIMVGLAHCPDVEACISNTNTRIIGPGSQDELQVQGGSVWKMGCGARLHDCGLWLAPKR